MKHIMVGFIIGIVLLIWSDITFAKEKKCGSPDYPYTCPPPPPTGPRTRAENEEFRKALEVYRTEVERERSMAPGQDLENYREALGEYQDGIENYRDFRPDQ